MLKRKVSINGHRTATLVFAGVLATAAITIQAHASDDPGYLNLEHKITSITVLAERFNPKTGSPPTGLREHITPETSVEFYYDPQSALGKKVESNLNGAVDYSDIPKSGPSVVCIRVTKSKNERYTVGGGNNQLDTYTYNHYGIVNVLKYSGVGLPWSIKKDYEAEHVSVSSLKTVSDESSQASDNSGVFHGVYEVQDESKSNQVVASIHVYSPEGKDGPYTKLEFYNGDQLVKTAVNSDFRDVGGVRFPYRIELTTHDANARTQIIQVKQALINPPLAPEVLESPRIKPGASVFDHSLVNGEAVTVKRDYATMGELNKDIASSLEGALHGQDEATAPPSVKPERLGPSGDKRSEQAAAAGASVAAPAASQPRTIWKLAAAIVVILVFLAGAVAFYSRRGRSQ